MFIDSPPWMETLFNTPRHAPDVTDTMSRDPRLKSSASIDHARPLSITACCSRCLYPHFVPRLPTTALPLPEPLPNHHPPLQHLRRLHLDLLLPLHHHRRRQRTVNMGAERRQQKEHGCRGGPWERRAEATGGSAWPVVPEVRPLETTACASLQDLPEMRGEDGPPLSVDQ